MHGNMKGPVSALRTPHGVRDIQRLFSAGREVSEGLGILPGELCVTVRRRTHVAGLAPRHEEIVLAVDLDSLRSLRESR
jgi:hypothetical protein